jgi:hypothetical protein
MAPGVSCHGRGRWLENFLRPKAKAKAKLRRRPYSGASVRTIPGTGTVRVLYYALVLQYLSSF